MTQPEGHGRPTFRRRDVVNYESKRIAGVVHHKRPCPKCGEVVWLAGDPRSQRARCEECSLFSEEPKDRQTRGGVRINRKGTTES